MRGPAQSSSAGLCVRVTSADVAMNNHTSLPRCGRAGPGAWPTLLALIVLPVLPALAQSDSYAYGGLSVGQSRAKIDQDRIANGLAGTGLSLNSMSKDQSDTGVRLFGGYQFNRYLALEGGIFSLGKFGFNATTSPVGTLSGDIKLQGASLDLVGTLPLGERWSLLGRVGMQRARATDHFAGTGAVSVLNPNPRETANNSKFGFGIQYEFSRSFLMRAEAERYRVNDAVGNRGSVNVVSLSAVFPFGRTEAARPRAALPPVYEVPPPARVLAPPPPPPAAPPVVAQVMPAPMPAPPPPPPERRRVSFSADSLFGFDRSDVRPEGKIALDKFAKDLAGTRFEVVVVEGHTDRLGSPAYNQKLSQRRADAVKAYLVSTGGIDAARISSTGKGESQPVTQTNSCKGQKQTPQLVSCLQPDRRVDVVVTGTR